MELFCFENKVVFFFSQCVNLYTNGPKSITDKTAESACVTQGNSKLHALETSASFMDTTSHQRVCLTGGVK